MNPTRQELAAGIELVRRSFTEDLGGLQGVDLTAVALAGARMRARVVARQAGVICGLQVAAAAFEMADVSHVRQLVADGATVAAGEALIEIEGDAAGVLEAERTALNIVQRLSGTATLTGAFVERVGDARARILDTRKTTPGMRALQRWAVRCGGGVNHRFGLFDEAMLKDNHIAASGSIAAAVAAIRAAHPGVRVHVEADTLAQVSQAADAGADVIMLDNMSLEQLVRAVADVGERALTEASGGVTLETVAEIAATGVDRISVGALTHSAPAFDVALDAVP